MLQLLADAMMFLLKAPFAVIQWVNQAYFQRLATTKAIKGVSGELAPLSKAKKFFLAVGRVAFWLVLVSLFVGILAGLWYLNDALSLERFLGGPWPSVRPFWLPVLFLLFLAACFIGYQLYRSLGPDADLVEFADIEDAWGEAKAALVEAGIDVTQVPLFLVLGRPASNLHAFMSATRLSFGVQQVPLKAKPPLQVYANKQAIYIVALDACLLGRQAELLADASVAAPPAEPDKPLHTVFEEPKEAATTVSGPTDGQPSPALAVPNLLADLRPADVGTEPNNAVSSTPWITEAGKTRMPSLLKMTEEVDKYKRRLGYLTRRLGKERAPFCPLNGVLVLLPFAILDSDEDASQVATLCQYDLGVLHETARTRCPFAVVVADLETAPGYAALSESLDADRRLRLFGQDLPLVPDLKPAEFPLMVASSLHYFNQVLAQWVFRLFRVEKSAGEMAAPFTAANTQLYEFLAAVRLREKGLERILTRILGGETNLEFLLGGFYLAATGANADREQAFLPGVFQQLVQSQNCVAWTDAALAEEADYRRWTVYGYAALALFCIAFVVLLYGRWQMLQW